MSTLLSLLDDTKIVAGMAALLYVSILAVVTLTALYAASDERRRTARDILAILMRRPN